MRSALAILLLIFLSPLHAQGGEDVPIEPVDPVETPDPNEEEYIDEGYEDERMREIVREEINALRRENGFLFSANGIDLWAFGGASFEYRHSQANRRRNTLRAPFASGTDYDLQHAYLGLEGSYFDTNEFTDMQIATARLELAYERDEFTLNRASLAFNRPLTRFDIPFFKEHLSDSIELSLDQPFWANRHQVSASRSLMNEALARDEQLSATWTFSYGGWFYLLGGITSGSRLEADGEVDRTLNYALLQDDRESFDQRRREQGEITDSVGALFGTGIAIDLSGQGPVISRKRIWRPSHATKHLDVLHLLTWWSYDTLSPVESTLIESVTGHANDNHTKWRLGANLDLVLSNGRDAFYARAEYAHASDGDFSRNFTTLEASYAFDLGEAFPMLTVIQPLLRASWLNTNSGGPVVSNATALDSAEAIAAGIAADRTQITMALKLWFHRRIALSLEYTINDEEIGVPAGIDDSVDNNLFLLSLQADF